METEIRLAELKTKQSEHQSVGTENLVEPARAWDDSLAGRTKKFGESLRHVLPHMPAESAELPQFFDTVEKLFDIYLVPADLQAKLIIPILTTQAKAIIGRMSCDDLKSYDKLKSFLLGEFKLTPREYKSRFDTAHKASNETYVLFASRLHNLLSYYLRSREVSDFESLVNLLVSDKLKSCLPMGSLNYVLSLEGNDWFEPSKVASLADTYTTNHESLNIRGPQTQQPRQPRFPQPRQFVQPRARAPAPSRGYSGSYQGRPEGNSAGRGRGQSHPLNKCCFVCNSPAHFAKDCPHGRGRGNRPPLFESQGKTQVNSCSTCGNKTDSSAPAQVNLCTALQNSFDCRLSHDNVANDIIACKGPDEWEFGNFPEIDVTMTGDYSQVKVSPLKFVEISIDGERVVALRDSGAMIPLINRDFVNRHGAETWGSITVQGVFGQAVEAPLVCLGVRLADKFGSINITPELPIVCAVVDLNSTEYCLILPSNVVKELQQLPVITTPVVAATVSNSNSSPDITNVSLSTDVVNADSSVNEIESVTIESDELSDVQKLINEQQQDHSLSQCWVMASKNKGGCVISNGMLYHKDKVEGQTVYQLCVPIGRRDNVLRLAHDSVFGGHMGERKTRERIRLSFYWPGLKQSVKAYTDSCHECQLRSQKRTLDRVPITPITRDDVPFQTLNMDCIGPLDPPSAQGHKYCLCIVDNCTRWPSIYLLKSLTAKAVCEALLDLLVNVGVPKVIISDCGTNFTSQLTKEMLSHMGCTPRFNTPGHPEASGMVERFNQTCKKMLHHVIQQHGRQWHKFVHLMLWALREVPNATTGVSPYKLVYGRNPRGPLAILKESWTGEASTSSSLGQSVENYLFELKAKLEEAASYAEGHTKSAQQNYAAHYNLRAREKHFQEGDQVIVLAPDNMSKGGNRWQGPGTVVNVKSPHSYLIDMGQGNIRHVHANKVRRYMARVQGCGVIADSDIEFGRVLIPDSACNENDLPSVKVETSIMEHLDERQRSELVQLLDEFADCFKDKPGLCDVIRHRIVTTPEFVPKQMKPYRVPEIFRPEVDRQIKELLDLGLIRPSLSPMASPIVCVAKKTGGVRIACDYRYLNSFTVGDAFPMATINETLSKIGAAKFISTFDAKSGYWQIPVAEQDRWLTAFVTHDGLYEWLRMPFGLKNAGATFVRAVRIILQPIRDFSQSYVDDMGVGSNEWYEHLAHIR